MNTSAGKQNPRTPKPSHRITNRFSQRQILWIGAGISAAAIIILIIVNQFAATQVARANTLNDFRSVANGNWSSNATWQRFDGSNWIAATSAPGTSANVISIRNGHNVTVNSNTTADQVVVDAGGTLSISSTLTLANGTGVDLINNGSVNLTNAITLNSGAAISHNSGSTYIHNRDGGTIPAATWHALSTCQITGISNSMPAQINQNYGNLTWNCSGQNGNLAFNTNMSIQGNFTVSHTGNRYLGLSTNSSSYTFNVGGNWVQTRGDFRGSNSTGGGTITIAGDFNLSGSSSNSWYTSTSGAGVCNTVINGSLNISGGGFWVNEDNNAASLTVNGNYNHTDGQFTGNLSAGGSTTTINGNFSLNGSTSTSYITLTGGSGLSTMNVNGNASITGGTLALTESSNNGVLNLKGNLTYTAGVISESATSNTGEVVFNGTSTQLCDVNTAATNTINFTVRSGAFLQFALASSFLQSAGNFTLESGGRIGIRATDGISSSGSTGHIRVSGTRSYNTGADYDYNGSALQNTGNGLPATVRNLTVDNSAGITLTSSTNPVGTLSLQNGLVNTGSNQLTLGTSATSTGTLSRNNGYVNGNFRRWVASAATSNILFPVGTSSSYNGFNISFTSAPTGGLISSVFQTGYPGNFGLPLVDATEECSSIGSGIWTLSGSGGFSGGFFNVNVRGDGFTGINNHTLLRLFRRQNAASAWENSGTHAAPTGNISAPVINRNELTQLGQFGITSAPGNPLPVCLTNFGAKVNDKTILVSWSTASENNSDYFMVQRSADGKNYVDLQKVRAAGQSQTPKNYRVSDPQPITGLNYYRLLQYDSDGKSTPYGPATVSFNNSAGTEIQSLTAGPNPFRNEVQLRFESGSIGYQPLTVYNIKGAVVYRSVIQINTGTNTLPLLVAPQLQAGRYLIEMGEGLDAKRMQIVKI